MLATAWGGAVLFVASLSYFAYFYLVQLGRPVEATAEAVPRAVALNAALFTTFALHHSLFARTGLKHRLARVLPSGLERSIYVWVASLLFAAVCLLWQPLPGVAWHVSGPARWLLHIVQVAGVLITVQSASRIDIWELAGVRQARAAGSPSGSAVPSSARPAPSAAAASASSTATPLTIAGPYRWLRHPIYLGWMLFVFAAPLMTHGRLLFAGISTLYLIVAIPIEERTLNTAFGPAYRDYQRQVRWRLVPGIW